MKKTKQLLLPLVMAIVMMAMSPTMAWAISGSGTSSSPYQISSASDWDSFRTAVNSRSSASTEVYAKLTGSFTISSGSYTPVGTSSKPFYGEFNGQGYTITLSNAKGSSDDFGLFGYVSNATIQNLKVAGTLTVTGTKKHIGGIVAYLKGASTIKGCTFSGTLDAGSSYDSNGGIVGFAENGFSGSITNCFCNATFKTTSSDSNPTFGGIVGYFNDESSKLPTISNNFSDSQFLKSGSSYTSSYTNGIIGRIRNKATNVTNNTYITSSSLSRACNNDGATIDSSNKAITISVTAGTGGSVSKSYVYPTSSTATKVQVVASPSSHYVFDKWTSSSSSSTSISTSTSYLGGLTSSVSLYANFKRDSHTITATSANSNMGTVSGGASYTHGTTAKITATAKTGYSFDYWMNGSTKSTTNPISFTVESDQTYTAYFKVNQYKITATTNNEKYGTVTGGGTYDYNKSVTLTATPATGYHFVSWSDGTKTYKAGDTNCATNANGVNTLSINVPASNTTYTATFAPNQYTITLKKYSDIAYRCKIYANGTESTGGTYDYGTQLTLKAVPDTYCYFSAWKNGDNTVSSTAEFTYEVKGDATLTAVCYKTEYTLTLQANNAAMGTVSGGGKCDAYTDATIKATANDHYHFVNWTKDGAEVATSATVTNYRAHGNETLVANFAIDQHTITAQANNEDWGTVAGSDTYDYNSQQTLTATPKQGYHFVSWNDGNTNASRQITVTGAATYTATFEAHDFTSQTTTETYFASAATCTHAATYYYYCSRCDEKGTETFFSTEDKDKALGHDFTSKTTTEAYLESAATCTEAATYYYKCSRCSEMGTETYTSTEDKDKAKGHTVVTDRAVEASCTETGLAEGSHCSVCKAVIVAQESTPAKGHTVVTDRAVEASCTETGLTEGSHCSLCEEVIVAQETIPAKGHSTVKVDAKAATCGDTGNTDHWKCTACGKLFSNAEGTTETTLAAVTTNALGHKYDTNNKCTVCQLLVDPAQAVRLSSTASSGTSGYSGENYDKLFDGNTSTKWCLKTDNPFVEFSTSELVYVTGYSFTTGDDTWSNPSRNPKTWKLSAKTSPSDAWTKIDSKSNDETLGAVNKKEYQFALSKPTALRYQYFRLEFTHSGTMQLSEISLFGCNERSLCTHSQMTHHEGVPATCTTAGTREYWSCPDCDKMFSSATASAETMISDTTAPKLPHTIGADGKCSVCGATGMPYLAPTYNTPGDASSGIASWTTANVASNVTTITSSSTTLSAGWYLISDEVTITRRITCNGAVHLILAPGSKLNAYSGITVSGNDNSLTIYGQPDGAGELIAEGGTYAAGIGGENYGSGSNITINGGTVTATGGDYAAGIGGGNYDSGSNITINGGTVAATGGKYASGIGGGEYGSGSDITINGGTVTATGGVSAAGIGGGYKGSGSTIFISTSCGVLAGTSTDKTVVTNDGSDLASKLNNKQYVVCIKDYTRTLTSEWETLAVPFAVTITDNDNYEFYSISGVDGSNLLINKAAGTLAAGAPVLVHKKVEGQYKLTVAASNKDVSIGISNPAAMSGLTLKGIYAKAPVDAGAGYVFDGSKFVKTTVSTDVAPFHAYLAGAISDVDAITPQMHVHSTVQVDAVTATCDNKGNIEHWKCTVCYKLFSDAEGKTETTLAAVTIAKAHNWSDDSHTYCTKCNRSFIYYTASEKVTPDTPASLSGYDDANNTYDSETQKGVIELPSKLTSIGENAFFDCSGLQSITIPSSVTSIGESAFSQCRGLQSITIPSSVTSIGVSAFSYCTNLQSITIPSSVTSIGNYTFDGCTSLKKVAFNSIPQLGYGMFDYCDDLNTKTLALTDDSYVAADKGEFPTLTAQPTFTREMSTEWETIVVPFDIIYSQSNADYKLYQLIGTSAAEISIIEYDINATIPAGTPMLIKAIGSQNTSGKYEVTLTANGYDVSTDTNNPAAISGLTLTGTYAKASVAAGAGYVFNGTQFVKTTVSTDVAPFHAYLDGAIDGVDDITPKIHIHSIVKVDAKAATCGDTGNTEHWKCNGCGKLYSDAEGTNETTLATVTTNALGHQFDANNKCTVCQLVVDPAQAARLSSTASSGTHSTKNEEDYDNLFDGKTSTKWCLNETNPFVEFSTSELVYVTGYSFTTGDDTESSPSRNPKTWKLFAKSSSSGAWTEIDSKSNDETLGAENEKEYQFALSKPTALRYQYFRLEFTHSGLMQLSEISVYGCNERSLCAHSKALTHHEGVPATCTTTGTREYWSCPDCDKMFSSATASAETMISDTTAPKLPHTVGADSKCSACGAPCISYLVPTYNTPGDASSGIASWTTAYVATSDVTTITSTSTTLPAGWYLVCNEVTITSRITCNGDVHLILAPDSKLNAKAGINVSGNANSLTIYGQPDGAGELIAMGGEYAAGIGGGDKGSGSNITINGGTVTATGGDYAAGIGGGYYDSGSNITINGGTVTATGGYCAAGIGGGRGGAGSDITINGGTVTATGGYAGAGIGGGLDGSGSDIKVSTNLVTWNRSNNDAVIANDGSDLASALSGVNALWIGPSHTHNYINKVSEACMVTPATCTKLATFYRCCEICGKSEENQEHIFEGGELKPHDFTNRVEDNDCLATAGNCTLHATYYYCCAVCGNSENNAEHTFEGTTYTHTFVDGICSQCQKTGVAYLVPTYKTARVKASGIASWTTDYVAEYTTITSESTTLSAGWYLVSNEVTINDRITCNGAVHLILATGSKLNAQAGITVSGKDNSLTIYGQPDGAGELVATGGDYDFAAGIGGGNHGSGSNITINGGTVTASGGYQAAGIGGGNMGAGSDITINGGTVTATGGINAAGIGGGNHGSGSNITINGGTVTASGGYQAAGIGGGNMGAGSTIFISTSCSVLAGTSTNMTVVTNDGSDLASKLNGKNVVRVKELSPGDLNADGNITISDLTLLVELLNAGGTITHPAADVDRDGDVDIDDVNALRSKLLGM